MAGPGAVVIIIEKKNNKEWSFVRLESGLAIDPDAFSAKKTSCSVAMSNNPEK
jgi:hypothetical protein